LFLRAVRKGGGKSKWQKGKEEGNWNGGGNGKKRGLGTEREEVRWKRVLPVQL